MSRIFRVITSPMDDLPDDISDEDLILPSDYPIGGITNLQMQKALSAAQEGLYKHNSVYVCLDNGTYLANHLYRFNETATAMSWVEVCELDGGIEIIRRTT